MNPCYCPSNPGYLRTAITPWTLLITDPTESVLNRLLRSTISSSYACLLEKTLEGHLVGLGGDGQFLDRDGSVEVRVVGQVDGTEGALAQGADDAVFEELLVGGKGYSASSACQVHT